MPAQRPEPETPSPLGPDEAAPRTRRAAVMRWTARALLTLVLLVGATTSLLPQGRAVARGVVLLAPLLSASQPAAFVAVGEDISHSQLTLPSASGTVFADVYAPTTPAPLVPGAHGGLLIIPGLGDERAEPQLVNLADALARTGVVVMLMTTQTLINYDVTPADSDAVVQAFNRLARWKGVGADRVGIVGFSAGGPLACLADVDPRIRGRVAFITQFGGYFDIEQVLRDIGRRALDVNGRMQPWQPNSVPLEVFANVLAHTLPEYDGARLKAGFAFANPSPLTADEVALLSPAGAAVYHLLAGDAPDAVEANIALIQPGARDLLAQLSPRVIVSQIRAPIYLLHDANDPYIPFTEARDFAAALTKLHHPHDYVELAIFQHTEVRQGSALGHVLADGSRLARILYDALLVGS